ncbi:hypothetical protein PT2222_60177 [Paraburkholderia tropica]
MNDSVVSAVLHRNGHGAVVNLNASIGVIVGSHALKVTHAKVFNRANDRFSRVSFHRPFPRNAV